MKHLKEAMKNNRPATVLAATVILVLAIAPAALSRSGVQFGLAVPVADADDCKKGGWQDFGVFKNQGDCVSYVVTGGRNLPAGSTTTTAPTTTSTTTTTTTSTTTTTIVGNLPTDKDDCKKGGWEDFGVFKNQGDCVSYVATGGSNPPDGPSQ